MRVRGARSRASGCDGNRRLAADMPPFFGLQSGAKNGEDRMSGGERGVGEYYRSVAAGYREQYEPGYSEYPANLERLNLILARLEELGARSVLDCGCGEGTPIRRIHEQGIEVWGFDFEPAMVELARENLGEIGLGDRVWHGDISDPESLRPPDVDVPETVDVCTAMGVFPHVADEIAALEGMASKIGPGGKLLIEFRNELFALFTLNRYSLEFFRDELIDFAAARDRHPDQAATLDEVQRELATFFRVDQPPRRTGDSDAPGYDEIEAKFRNPLVIGELFAAAGLVVDRIHYYHFHAFPPLFESRAPALFRTLSLELEHDRADWRGAFMCSAFVVEASRRS
jgi:SAM-dependent methyltransferase